MKKILKFILSIAVIIALIFLALNFYFKHIYKMDTKVQDSFQARIKKYHITPINYSQIPDFYRKAVVSTEDRRFSWDPGIDPIGIIRSIKYDVQKDGYIEGGSTITQQLVDNTLIQHGQSITYKLTQVIYAIGIYDTVSKKNTFDIYANVIYFGHGAYGLYNAAETYFGRSPNKLNSGELALLAGLPNAPSAYDPFQHMKLARERQKTVILNMIDNNTITKNDATKILKEPLRLKSN